MKKLLIVLILPLILSTGFSQSEHRMKESKQAKVAKQTGAVKQQKSEDSQAKDKIDQARSLLAEAKKELAQEDKYNCCIKDPCNFCGLLEASCDCYPDLKKGEHVCIECYAGWQQGKGVDEKIRKENVKTSFVQHSHKH